MAAFGCEAVQQLSKVIHDSFPSMERTIFYGSVAFPQIKSNQEEQEENKTEIIHNDIQSSSNSSFFSSLSLANIVSPYYSYKLHEPMFDFIFIVNDSKQWHSQNLSTSNYYHYATALRLFGSSFISYFQSFGPGVFYNTFVSISNCNIMIKYGVITTSQLVEDLIYWKSLYIAGRLHKPVLFLNNQISNDLQPSCDTNQLAVFYDTIRDDTQHTTFTAQQLSDAMALNLDYAVRVSLVMLSDLEDRATFTLKEFFITIASLSYCGDIRHKYGAEDVHKYEKIVNGSYARFVEMYDMVLRRYIECVDGEYYALKQGVDVEYLCRRLPCNLRNEMVRFDDDIMNHLEDKHRVCECMKHALCAIVKHASRVQTCKGFVSIGLVNSFWYVLRKVNKYLTSVSSGGEPIVQSV
eukprot:772849_1